MTKRSDVTRRQKVERLHLVPVALASIHRRKWSEQWWTADRQLANGGKGLESDRAHWKTKGTADDIQPDLCNPRAVVRVGIRGIQQMAKTMLGPSIFSVVCESDLLSA